MQTYDSWACSALAVEVTWDDDGMNATTDLVPCDEPVHLISEAVHYENERLSAARIPDAITWGWRLECERGHVLLTGAHDDENHAPYDPAWIARVARPVKRGDMDRIVEDVAAVQL